MTTLQCTVTREEVKSGSSANDDFVVYGGLRRRLPLGMVENHKHTLEVRLVLWELRVTAVLGKMEPEDALQQSVEVSLKTPLQLSQCDSSNTSQWFRYRYSRCIKIPLHF